MTTTFQTDLTNKSYNGWTNYETWNVALWIGNDENLYHFAREFDSYAKFVSAMPFGAKTPDGVEFASTKLNYIELDEMLEDL